jgi:hypothetical protein
MGIQCLMYTPPKRNPFDSFKAEAWRHDLRHMGSDRAHCRMRNNQCWYEYSVKPYYCSTHVGKASCLNRISIKSEVFLEFKLHAPAALPRWNNDWCPIRGKLSELLRWSRRGGGKKSIALRKRSPLVSPVVLLWTTTWLSQHRWLQDLTKQDVR